MLRHRPSKGAAPWSVVPSPSPSGLLVVACAHTPGPSEPAPSWGIASASTPDTFEIGGTAHGWAVKVSEEQILGVEPDLGLARSEGEIRGRALKVPVVVGFHGDQGAGVYRGAPFEVFVARTPTGLDVTGIFAGTVSDFELSTARINGQVGICAYDLRWNGKVYLGYRGCGEKVEPISVSLPATMARWSDVEVAGALGLLDEPGWPDPDRPSGGQLGPVPQRPRAGPRARPLLRDGRCRPDWYSSVAGLPAP